MILPWPAKKFFPKAFTAVLCSLLFLSHSTKTFSATFNIANGDTSALINAINTANNNGEEDIINLVDNGEYLVSSTNNYTYSNSGLPLITSDITLNGQNATISRSSAENFRILSVVSPAKLTINNLTVKNGFDSDTTDDYGGGGIFNLNATLFLNNSYIEDNRAEVGGGGGIWIGGDSSTTISNTKIFNNSVGLSASGGGLTKRGLGPTVIVNSELFENHADDNNGGAIYSSRNLSQQGGSWGGSINISQSRIYNNTSKNVGGAIYNFDGQITINNSCIYGNTPRAVENGIESHFIIDATQNWWGASDGPSGYGGGYGDYISDHINYLPFLSSCPPLASPSPSPAVSPSPIPSPSPEPSPSPSPLPSLIPVVLLPGLGGSWNTPDLITGASGGVWKKTPFIKVYDNLKNTLLTVGYVENQNYFEFYYDWRKPIDSLADQLNDFINSQFDANTKINLVGHSLGGLVSRTYGQKYGETRVNKIITTGTPHEGTIPAYLAWSGAQISSNSWEQLGLDLYLHLHQGKFNSPVTAIQTLSPSLKDLLPIFEFTIPAISLHTTNNYLVGLKKSLTLTLSNLMFTIAGVNQQTTEQLKLGNRSISDKLLGRWKDGKPIGIEPTDQGDGTILKNSALLLPEINQMSVNASHIDLVQTETGINAILNDLGITAVPQSGNEQPVLTPALFFLLHSPAEISVIGPNGPISNYFYSNKDKLLLIYQALAGNYQVKVSGTGTGEYQLDIGQLTNQGEVWSSLIDSTQPGAVDNWTVNFNPDNPLPDPVVDPTGNAKIDQAKLRLKLLKTQTHNYLLLRYIDDLIRLLEKDQQYRFTELALTATYKFRYWVDRFSKNDPYLKSETDAIGQLISEALVTKKSQQKLNKNIIKAELSAAQREEIQLEKRAGKIKGENFALGNTLELIIHYLDRAKNSFDANNLWSAHADLIVVRILQTEASALIR